MNRILIALTFLIGISINGTAQQNVNENEMVGFGCYFEGRQSKSVQQIDLLIDKEKYSAIVDFLDSKNNAEKFLAVVVCEKLVELDKLTLTQEMKEKIAEIYKSDGIVSVCSGCTYWDRLTLRKILDKDNNMRISSKYWLDKKFKKS